MKELVSAHTLQMIVEIPLLALRLPSWPFIFVPHTFNTCVGLRPYLRREFWLLGFILTLLAGVGGNLLYSLFTHGHPFFLSKSMVLPVIAVVWWLVNYSPYDIVWRIYHWRPVRYALQIVAALNRCRSVCAGFDKGREIFPSEPASLFSFAILAGLSGGLVTVWVKKLMLRPSDAPVHTEFSKPTWVLGSAVLASVWLYCIEELHLLPIPEARAMYVAAALSHALLEPLLGTGFVPFPLAHVWRIVLASLGIPATVQEPSLLAKKEKSH